MRPVGFTDVTREPVARWASPRASDPKELARILLQNPHLVLVQWVEPLSDEQIERSRTDFLTQLVQLSGDSVVEAIGTPVCVSAAVFAEAGPWTLPLRVREHLRGWFTVLDIHEDRLLGVAPGEIMPEHLAAGLLRFPTTDDTSFPGMGVEPKVVACDGVEPAAVGVRIGTAQDLQGAVDVRLDREAMSRHVHIIGETGSGKSTLLTAIALETAKAGEGLMLLDPHGTTVDRVISELPPQHRDRVWLIRCGDTANPIRLNPFDVPEAETPTPLEWIELWLEARRDDTAMR